MIEFLLAAPIVFFVLALLVRTLLGVKVCTLCAAVALSWVTLIIGGFAGWWIIDPVALSLYMGGSIVGVMYLLARILPERLHVFKLPFLLSLLWGAYEVIVGVFVRAVPPITVLPLVMLAAVWLITLIVYLGRNTTSLSGAFTKLIECCKNW